MINQVMRWWWLTGGTLAAWEDIRSRRFSLRLLLIWTVSGIGFMCLLSEGAMFPVLVRFAESSIVGVSLLLLSRITRGAIGKGDGLFFLMSAFYLEVEEVTVMFLGGLGIGCIWGAVLRMAFTKKNTIPFLACIWPVGFWLVCR